MNQVSRQTLAHHSKDATALNIAKNHTSITPRAPLTYKKNTPAWQDHNAALCKKNINTSPKAWPKDLPEELPEKSPKDSKHPIRLSFQLMTRAEPFEMVIATIESLLTIKSDDDEILIIDNNHDNTELYEPLEAYCAALDPGLQVKFYHIDAVAGFKSGALNLALGLMDPFATHVVVVDSDYQALRHARAAIEQAINTYPDHALLQFPQFYRDAGLVDVHSELNHYFNHHLYRAFNQSRALSTGTFAVIRRDALTQLGGWSGASITEDAQMGVLMHKQGFKSRFVPQVIANGLLPTTVCDLMAQRQRWIYGNMQVVNAYFSINTHSLDHACCDLTANRFFKHPPLKKSESKGAERWHYLRAHLSQLGAWVNFTGIFIILQLCVLLIATGLLASGQSINPAAIWMPLYAVYASYGLYLLRRLWAYAQDKMPLNQQVAAVSGVNPIPATTQAVRTWLVHLNFWELGALSWVPLLWGRDKPFVCTPKQKLNQSRRTLWLSNVLALPKLLLLLNIATLILTAPLSPLYSPFLFVCASVIVALKLAAGILLLTNYDTQKSANDIPAVATRPSIITSHTRAGMRQDQPLTSHFKNKETLNY